MAGETYVLSERDVQRIARSILEQDREERNLLLRRFRARNWLGFKLVRGTAVNSVSSGDATFQMQSLVPLGQHSLKPKEPLTVANIPGLSLDAGELCYAAWSYSVGGAGVDWEVLDLQGMGETVEGTVTAGCGIALQITGGTEPETEISVDHDQLAGAGLIAAGECGLAVFPGCGIAIDVDNTVTIEPSEIAGLGLEETGGTEGCTIDVKLGCHLSFDGNNAIEIDGTSLAGDGLGITVGACNQLKVNAGCGLEIDSDQVIVKNSDLAGAGLTTTGTCGLAIDVGCGVAIDVDNTLTVDASDLAGQGLEVASGTSTSSCALDVCLALGGGLEFDESGCIKATDEILEGGAGTENFCGNADGLLTVELELTDSELTVYLLCDDVVISQDSVPVNSCVGGS